MTTEDFIGEDFTRRPAPRGVPPGVVVGVVLASGAAFGLAVQSTLQHLGLDFASIHNDLINERAASARAAMAWWAWWLAVPAAFLVGPSSAALTRAVVANWWRMRALRLGVTAAAVLGLAAVGGLRPAPSTLAFTTNTALGLLLVAASTLLALLGARVLGAIGPSAGLMRTRVADRAVEPLRAAPPWRGGGSAVGGLPFLRFRERHPLAPGPFSPRRLALLAVLALVMFVVVSTLGGTTALVDTVATGPARGLVASWLPHAGTAGHARRLALALLPEESPRRIVMPPVALLDLPPPKPVEPPKSLEPPEPRQRAISASVGYGGPALSETELTFTKGYSRRRAAQLVATMTSLPSIPQLTAAINIKKIRDASLRFTQDRRVNRPVADSRRVAESGTRASRPGREIRYSDYHPNDRRSRYDRRHAHDRYSDSRFARADAFYRRF